MSDRDGLLADALEAAALLEGLALKRAGVTLDEALEGERLMRPQVPLGTPLDAERLDEVAQESHSAKASLTAAADNQEREVIARRIEELSAEYEAIVNAATRDQYRPATASIVEAGDDLQYGGPRLQEAFAAASWALAVLSLAPGGVKFAGGRINNSDVPYE